MGSVSDELAQRCAERGCTIRTGMPVRRIVVENGRVPASKPRAANVSTADRHFQCGPEATIMELVGARHVETGFTQRIHHLRMRGNAAKLHLALDGLPTIDGLSKKDFAERIVIAPDEHYVERAFNPAKYGESSPEPVLEITFPSFRDDARADGQARSVGGRAIRAVRTEGRLDDAARQEFEHRDRTIERIRPDMRNALRRVSY